MIKKKESEILCISGSPRKGHTEYILRQISDKLGAELILLRDKNIGLCKGCMHCLKSFDCIMKDDSQDIIDKMHKSNLIIFGIPNYFNNVSGLFKNFTDRLLPLYKNKTVCRNEAIKGKKVLFVFVGGGGEKGTEEDVYNALSSATRGMVKYLDLEVVGEYPFVSSESLGIRPQQSKIDEMIAQIQNIKLK